MQKEGRNKTNEAGSIRSLGASGGGGVLKKKRKTNKQETKS
jgi:hypothetical protein